MTSPPDFPKHPADTPTFWDVRFAAGYMPWDQGGVPQNFARFVQASPRPYRVLIPGCGAAHEVALLAARQWPVMAIDFSSEAVAAARQVLGVHAQHVHEMDFFSPAVKGFQANLIYERAFLCALPRRLWARWAAQVRDLLSSGDLLAGYFFVRDEPKGPPFGLAAGELATLLAQHFVKIAEETPPDSVTIFRGHEKWMVWQRQ